MMKKISYRILKETYINGFLLEKNDIINFTEDKINLCYPDLFGIIREVDTISNKNTDLDFDMFIKQIQDLIEQKSVFEMIEYWNDEKPSSCNGCYYLSADFVGVPRTIPSCNEIQFACNKDVYLHNLNEHFYNDSIHQDCPYTK